MVELQTLIVAVSAAVLGAVGVGPAFGQAQAYTRWQHTLTSTKDYGNPYADVTVGVTYTGPRGQTLDTYGFWDGGDTFRIRANFPTPGEWTWRTTSSDPSNAGLHDQSGVVTVAPYTGDNPLYRHGALKVSDNQRYLTYADGTPFLWVGDTAWVAPLHASRSGWETYVEDRAAKGFSVIQLSPASAWGGTRDVHGNEPFLGEGASKWNPAYWQGLGQKVQYANEQGLVVLLVGVMAPVHEEPQADSDPSEFERFARNIAGRLAGNQVVLSPSFDSSGSQQQINLGNAVGQVLDDAVLNQLITQHSGQMEAIRAWHDEPYVDFVGMESAHRRRRWQEMFGYAIHSVREAYGMEPTKPVINLEIIYASDTSEDPTNRHASAAVVRHTAYMTILSGSTSGMTYGARGVWGWETDPDKQWYWRDAIEYPSATQMGHLQDFFSNIEWWELAPASDLVASNESIRENALLRAFAMSEGGDLGVGYIPPGATDMTLDMSGFAGEVSATWFNPRAGDYLEVPGELANSGLHTFTRPGVSGWDDAVLLLHTATIPEPGSAAMVAAVGGAGLLRRRRGASLEAASPQPTP